MIIKVSIFLIALVVIFVIKYFQLKRKANAVVHHNHLLNGIKLTIPADDITIKSKEYWEEHVAEGSQKSMLDALVDSNRNYSQTKKAISVLIYEGVLDNKKVKFTSLPIYEDEATLRVKLYSIKELTVYIDPSNEHNYYFDLSNIS